MRKMLSKIKEKMKKIYNWFKKHKKVFYILLIPLIKILYKDYSIYKKGYINSTVIFDLYRRTITKHFGHDPVEFKYDDRKNGIVGYYTYDDLLDKILEMNISKDELFKKLKSNIKYIRYNQRYFVLP